MPPRRSAGPPERRPNALVVLSGLHASLPESEVLACAPSRVVARRERLLLIETPFPDALDRLGYATLVLDFLGVGTLERLPFVAAEVVRGTYAVRVSRVPAEQKQQLYRLIWRALADPHVALRHPDTELHAFVLPDGVWWARLRRHIGDPDFADRRVESRPFFRSYGMQPRKSRCMVNLTGIRAGQRLLDPCCGTGSFLIEAALMGVKAFGSDSDAMAVAGAHTNLEALGLKAELRQLDARRLDTWGVRFDAIVSDLPYGLSASKSGVMTNQLYGEIVEAAALVLPRGRVAVFAAPLDMLPVPRDQFVVLERHHEFVHRSLAREITVLGRR